MWQPKSRDRLKETICVHRKANTCRLLGFRRFAKSEAMWNWLMYQASSWWAQTQLWKTALILPLCHLYQSKMVSVLLWQISVCSLDVRLSRLEAEKACGDLRAHKARMCWFFLLFIYSKNLNRASTWLTIIEWQKKNTRQMVPNVCP